MSTEDIISARRDAAIQKWTEAVFAMYPFETTGFIRTQRDQFANPVGHATRAAGEQIYDAVTGRDVDMEKVHASVAALIRIRAVQDLKPEQAVGVLYLYKPCFVNCSLRTCWPPGMSRGSWTWGIVWTRSASWPQPVPCGSGAGLRRACGPTAQGGVSDQALGGQTWPGGKSGRGIGPVSCFPFGILFIVVTDLDMSNFKPGVR